MDEEERHVNRPETSQEPTVQINPAKLISEKVNLEEMKQKFGIEFVIVNKENTEHFNDPKKTIGCRCSAQKFYEKYYDRIVKQMQIYDETDDNRTGSSLTQPPTDLFAESYGDERIPGATESWLEAGSQASKREESEEFESLEKVVSYDDFEEWSIPITEPLKVQSKPEQFVHRSTGRKIVTETLKRHVEEIESFPGTSKLLKREIAEMITTLEESLEYPDENWPESSFRRVKEGEMIFKKARGVSFSDDSEMLSLGSEREADYDYICQYMERCLKGADFGEEAQMGYASDMTKHPPSLISWGEEEEISKSDSCEDLSILEKYARKYMKEHKIDDVFKYFCAQLLVNLPENPIEFLILLLDKCMSYRRTRQNPPLLFQKRHVESLFKSMDPMGYDVISPNQYKTGMFTLGLRSYSPPVENEEKMVTKEFFVKEAMRILKSNLDEIIYDHSIRYNVSIYNE